MRHFFVRRKQSLLLLLCATLLCLATLVCGFTGYSNFTRLTRNTATSKTMSVTPTSVLAKHQALSNFEDGISYPRWMPDGFSTNDTQWTQGLQDIAVQTHASWIEMPILFYQSTLSSTTVTTGLSTPTVASFAEGIRAAHARGYSVFVTPLLTVSSGSEAWAGAIAFPSVQAERLWFASYWLALKPYVVAAQQNGAEQFAIGTEEEWLQQNAPAELWNSLIHNFRAFFSGALTYDMNWTALQKTPPSWMQNSTLHTIGVSAYLSLTNTRKHIEPKQLIALWKNIVGNSLDAFAMKLGKPVLISEIGYRNSADALYHTWESTSAAPDDPIEQAAACNAALANTIHDPHILGIFFWGWDDVGAFGLRGQSASSVLQHWYSIV